jgi:hypothetical protein
MRRAHFLRQKVSRRCPSLACTQCRVEIPNREAMTAGEIAQRFSTGHVPASRLKARVGTEEGRHRGRGKARQNVHYGLREDALAGTLVHFLTEICRVRVRSDVIAPRRPSGRKRSGSYLMPDRIQRSFRIWVVADACCWQILSEVGLEVSVELCAPRDAAPAVVDRLLHGLIFATLFHGPTGNDDLGMQCLRRIDGRN